MCGGWLIFANRFIKRVSLKIPCYSSHFRKESVSLQQNKPENTRQTANDCYLHTLHYNLDPSFLTAAFFYMQLVYSFNMNISACSFSLVRLLQQGRSGKVSVPECSIFWYRQEKKITRVWSATVWPRFTLQPLDR